MDHGFFKRENNNTEQGGGRMKCPYRIIQTVSVGERQTRVEDSFADCYGHECPYYVKYEAISNVVEGREYCERVDCECRGGYECR